ncbi:hypothetical protein AUK11_00685 [bacterium CG2_30_37_16]|nr:MAG: hypothetical protein AUK11_00685 [bacterium CG2_30_37_16]PIP30364.1 MAG: hypothetical protein COX25_05020 [bacterium (Candidatus Howlettbacteria) CG23_combo_of_CG06-09_8_20_14_all_37_9]PIY00055.1 MAG: hypothetical protein COZ22_01220 [bacterium (Candidatus Howlettbacteria) CG_4_10_14_3_um_filter_37_10]PJB06970.1 MAG: hypothetical protein CO123_00910 [bacterium (Candidatus Howlettbacteria) CG_4_9_14_3_um_filter_37_10]
MIDLAIIGSGPAGLSAAVYAARYLMDFKIYGQLPGGYVSEAHEIGNYLGFPNITGTELTNSFLKHLESLDVKIQNYLVKGIRKEDGYFSIHFDEKEEMAKNILLCLGTERNTLNVPGEKEFLGKGVSYCATCDAFFYRNKTVAVIGGSDSAVSSAIYLSDVTEKVYLIYRKKELRAEPVWIKKAKANPKIEIIYETNIKSIEGKNFVEKIILDKEYKGANELGVNGIFIEIGSTPSSAIYKPLGVKTEDNGLIVVDRSQKTSVRDIWAAGDITTGSNKLRQVITAAAEGAIAIHDVYQTIKMSKG